MPLTATYDGTLSRVRLAATGLLNLVATVERSVDQITWVTVRGGSAITVAGGVLALDDYEFAADVVNYYRVRLTHTAITHLSTGAQSADANGADLTPALPGTFVQGDLLTVLASVRNSGAGTVATPTGYTLLVDGSNFRLFGKVATASETAPLVQFTGEVANATSLAVMAAWRGPGISPHAVAQQLNASAQDVAYPALTVTAAKCIVFYLGWKQDDWTSVATVAGATEIVDASSILGDDAGHVWDYVVQTAAANIVAGSFTVTGGLSAISRGATLALPLAPSVSATASLTPSLSGVVWLKTVGKPFLNRPVTVADWGETVRPSRSGAFNIVARSFPVAVTELRGSREVELSLQTTTLDAAEELDLILAAGDVVYVHTPADHPFPTMYAVVGDTAQARVSQVSLRRVFTLPLKECAAPGADVVGGTITWQGVINLYATWADVIAANATWAILLDRVGTPSDVIVP